MEILLEQLRELWSERRRVVWVALGVAWGTLSLTLLIAFGSSFVSATHGTIDNFGKDLLRVGGGGDHDSPRRTALGPPHPLAS